MTYFNGSMGFTDLHTGEYNFGTPTTRIYCDECAETAIPLPPREEGRIGRHWDTDFKWAPYYGGNATCHVCGKAC